MSVLDSIGGRISELFNEPQSHQAYSLFLYYRVELADEEKTRAEYNDRARELHQDLTKALTHSGEFNTVHLDRTLDPYLVLSSADPDLDLSRYDQRIQDLAEQAKERYPWPEGTEYTVEDLLDGYSTPEAARDEMKNVVTYEVLVKSPIDPTSKWGSPPALENARRITADFVAETDNVESIERFRPVEDGWYSFRFQGDEIRVRVVPNTEPPNVEWRVGYLDECPHGVGWVDFAEVEPGGWTVGELYFDTSNGSGEDYFGGGRHRIPMPKSIAESLIEDARASGA